MLTVNLKLVSLLLLLSVLHCTNGLVNVPANYSSPGKFTTAETPMFVILTYDDDCTDTIAKTMVNSLLSKSKNANENNCTMRSTWFCTSGWSSCTAMNRLRALGHEIATHTQTHESIPGLSLASQTTQIVGGRNDIINKCGIPATEVVGFRSPYLDASPSMRKIMKDNGFLYDSSMPVVYKSPESPSGSKLLWPYSMYNGIKQIFSCNWFGNFSGCSPNEKYDTFFQVPLWFYQNGDQSTNNKNQDIMNPYPAYNILKADFDRRYNNSGYRAPITVAGHWAPGFNYYASSTVRNEIIKFYNYTSTRPGVYWVTMRMLVDWIQAPVPVSRMKTDFLSKYPCPTTTTY